MLNDSLTEIIRSWGKDASIPDLEEINQIVDNLLFDKHAGFQSVAPIFTEEFEPEIDPKSYNYQQQ